MKNKCSVKGCKEPMYVKKHKLCRVHVARLYRTGDVIEDLVVQKKRKIKPYKAK